MARIRSIKPEFPQSETIGKLSRDARLLFIQLWTVVDDYGRARAAPKLLAGTLYPYDDDAVDLIDGWLDELAREGCIRRYVVDGSRYLDIPTWTKHQRIDNAGKETIPGYSPNAAEEEKPSPREETGSPRNSASHREPPQVSAVRGSFLGSRRGEEKDRYCRVADATPTTEAKKSNGKSKESYSAEFSAWWVSYPRTPTMSKLEAWRVWKKLALEDHAAATSALPGFRAYLKTKPDLEIVHACRFLSQRRFEGFSATGPPDLTDEQREYLEKIERMRADAEAGRPVSWDN